MYLAAQHFASTIFVISFCMAIFVLLAVKMPCNPKQEPVAIRSLWIDSLYWFLGGVVYGLIFKFFIAAGTYAYFGTDQSSISRFMLEGGTLAKWPLWLQVITILVIWDFIQYWMHRAFHRGVLWKYHAIHHGPEHVNWHTSVRFHPINFIFYSTMIGAFMVLMGFSPAAFAILGPFNVLFSCMVHANLNWTFGPLRYVIASPVFHRWHHTAQLEGRDKNFAPTFPFYDIMFGTFYMPKGVVPERYGIEGNPVKEDFIAQMLYPYQQK